MKPVLSYVGSKARFFDTIKDNIIPNCLYIEPFMGGFSLGLNLLERGIISKALANDSNQEVINFWSNIQKDFWSLAEGVDSIIAFVKSNNSTHTGVLNQQLQEYVKGSSVLTSALYYLYRKSNYGSSLKRLNLDTDFGSMNYTETFGKASDLLQNVLLLNQSYVELRDYDSKDTFWYLDPPYYSAKNDLFYTECRGSSFDHEALRDFCKDLEGVFVQSNFDKPYVRELYKDFYMYPVQVVSYSSTKEYTDELLIANKPLNLASNRIGKFKTKSNKGIEEDLTAGMFFD